MWLDLDLEVKLVLLKGELVMAANQSFPPPQTVYDSDATLPNSAT